MQGHPSTDKSVCQLYADHPSTDKSICHFYPGHPALISQHISKYSSCISTCIKNYIFLFASEFVCPSMGFFEFLKKDYIDQILSWQMPSGCFGDEGKGGLQPTRQPLNVPPELDLNKLLVSHSSNVNVKFNSPDQKQSELNLNSSSLLQFVREKSKVIGNFKPGEHGHRFPAQQEINLNAAKPLQQPVANFNARVNDQRGLSMNHDIENKLPVPVKDPNNQNVQGALGRGIQGKQIQDNEVHERKLLEFEVQQVPGSRRLLAEKEMLGKQVHFKSNFKNSSIVFDAFLLRNHSLFECFLIYSSLEITAIYYLLMFSQLEITVVY